MSGNLPGCYLLYMPHIKRRMILRILYLTVLRTKSKDKNVDKTTLCS